jgi:hypothetical protein
MKSHAQNTCSTYYPFTEGTITEVTSYDKKGKVTAVIEYEVTAADSEKATIANKVVDKDGEMIAESTFDMTCSGDGIEIDVRSMYGADLMAQYENMETSITGTDVALPNVLNEGDELPDAVMYISVDMGGLKMGIDVMMLDRRVVGNETVTTPAGDFDCVVIEYNSKIKMGLERNSSAKQWLAKGVGLVQQEDYNKKGKITGSTVLTRFEK